MKRKRKAMTAGLDNRENSNIQNLIYQDLTAQLLTIKPDIDISLIKKMIKYYMDVYYSEKNFNAEILLNAFKSIKDTVSPNEDDITQAFIKNTSRDHKLPLKNKKAKSHPEDKERISKEEKYNRPDVNLNEISKDTLEVILSKNYNFMHSEELEEYVHSLQNILNALREMFGNIPHFPTQQRSENTGENRVPAEQSLRWKAGYLQKQIRKYEQTYLKKFEIREFTIGINFFNSQSRSENWKTVYERSKLDEKSLCSLLEKITTPQGLQAFWTSLSIRINSLLMTQGYCQLTPQAKKFVSEYIEKINEDMQELKKNSGGKAPNFFQGSINLKPPSVKLMSAFLDLFKSHETRIMQEITEKYKLKRLRQNQQNPVQESSTVFKR